MDLRKLLEKCVRGAEFAGNLMFDFSERFTEWNDNGLSLHLSIRGRALHS